MSLSFHLTSSGWQPAGFLSFLVSSKTPGRPLFLFVGRNVRTSSWLLWVPFNYSSSNWAVFFDLTKGFCGRNRPISPPFFHRLVDFKTKRKFLFFFELGCWIVPPPPHWTTRPRTHPQPRVSISVFVGSHGRHKWTKQTSESTSPVSLWILGVRVNPNMNYIKPAVLQWEVNPDEIGSTGSTSPNPLLLFCCTGRGWGVGKLANK